MHHIPQLITPDSQVYAGHTTLAEGVGIPLSFGHAYITLVVCVSGCARFTLNFKERAVKQGDVLVLAEDTIAILKRRSRRFNVYFCIMPKHFAAEVAYELPNTLFLFLHHNPHCTPNTHDLQLVHMWVSQAQDIERHCSTYRRTMLRNHLQNFFLKISEQIPEAQEDYLPSSRGELLSWRFWELVGQHCPQHREVRFYADSLAITPYYLSQLTKRFFNETPKGLIDRQVTLQIKALLLYSDLTNGQVADRLDFNDASYLCRYFKRQTGASLTQFRSSAQDGSAITVS